MEIVLKYLGYLLLIFSVFPLLPAAAAIIYGESVWPFLALIVLTLLLGFWLTRWKKDGIRHLHITSFDLPRSISLFGLSYIVITVMGTIPYLLIEKLSFLDALFESVSGFTTTGLTIFTDVEILSKSLLLWRAETQWIGGLSIILLFLVIVSAMRRQESLKETTTKARAIANLYQAQGASEKIEANMKKSMKTTVWIYGCYTLVGIFLLSIAGLSIFESISIAFTAISTAGFSVTNQFYTSWPVLAVVSLLMLAGGIAFIVHARLLKLEWKALWNYPSLKFYIMTIVVTFGITFIFIRDVKVSLFQILSAFTTTGFSIADISMMPAVVIMLIYLGMMTGGMIGSTCGGIKTNRFRLMIRSIPWLVKKACSPAGAIIPLKHDNVPVEDEYLMITQAFIACYLIFLFIGTAILLITGLGFLDASFQTVSALGGVGLSTASPALFHPVAKVTLIIGMMFGRLEIIPLLVLGKLIYDRARRKMRRRQENARKLFYTRWIPSALWKKRP